MPVKKLKELNDVPMMTSEYTKRIFKAITDPLKSVIKYFAFEEAFMGREKEKEIAKCEKSLLSIFKLGDKTNKFGDKNLENMFKLKHFPKA